MSDTRKRILVTGDLIIDKNIARLPSGRKSYRDPCPATLESSESGGAWYLADILRGILAENCEVGSPGHQYENQAAQAITLWDMLCQDEGSQNTCWRTSEFMGCHCPEMAVDERLNQFEDGGDGDVVVLDDLGLAFAEEHGAWSSDEARACFSNVSAIIGKTTTLQKPLWQYLLTSSFAEKLTLVTTVDALREMGAQVRRSLSWDSSIEDLKAEFAEGPVGALLGHCHRVVVLFKAEGVGLFSRVPRTPDDMVLPGRLGLEQFVFDPTCLEGTSLHRRPGRTYGWLSWMTAAMVTSEVMPERYSQFVMVCRALGVIRALHRVGAGEDPTGLKRVAEMLPYLATLLMDPRSLEETNVLPEAHFGVAFARDLLDEGTKADKEVEDKSLLTDAAGYHLAFVRAKAEDVVLRGPDKALRRVPCARYGLYVTYDREEIERINSLRNLICDYLECRQQQPLCIAVFGQPGSGKSFAIKQLAKTLFSGFRAEMTFNLSQFQSLADLHSAFHQVRDMVLQGSTPLVFWDEFDSNLDGYTLRWLKDFLAPMQDGEFAEHGKTHPIGRAIFIFAGGTASSYAEFIRKNGEEKDKKAPDFISRLRGFVDIKGPNSNSDTDTLYPIRRALLLRTFIKKHFGDALFDSDGVLAIEPGILQGFLRTGKYLHGARSLEAVVSYSHLKQAYRFGPSELPPQELLEIHLENAFMACVQQGQRSYAPLSGFVNELIPRLHEIWMKAKVVDGWCYGEKRDDDNKTNPYLKPFDELTSEGKERNRGPAQLMLVKLEAVGLWVVPAHSEEARQYEPVTHLTGDEMKRLAVLEHQRWMRERLMEGVVYGKESSDELYTHCDICDYGSLPEKTARLDMDQIEAVFQVIEKLNLALVRRPED